MHRKQKTTFDYMVIGISPALVTMMVTSLALFVSTVLNPSPFLGRFNFILMMYSMATVAIARISIDEGKERAVLFGIPLAIVTMFAMSSLVQYKEAVGGMKFVYCAIVIAITWWSAHQLTWDCTVIDDHDDSSNQGLLQKIGVEHLMTQSEKTAHETNHRANHAAVETEEKLSWFEHWKANRKKPHTPGVWVIYYSLAALPLFGFGQLFTDTEVSSNCFKYLLCYVGSGLGLLLTTSLLGLRRYLRHRDVEMPREMAGIWLTIGVLMILGFMAFAFLLPRPDNLQQLAHANNLFNQSQDAFDTSEYGIGPDGKDDGNAGPSSDDTQQTAGPAEPNNASQNGNRPGEQRNQDKQSDSQASTTPDGQSKEKSQGDGNSAAEPGNQENQSDEPPSGGSSNQSNEQKSLNNNSNDSPSEQGDGDGQINQGNDENQSNQNSNSERNNPQESQSQGQNKADDPDRQNQPRESEPGDNTSSQGSPPNRNNSPSFQLPLLPPLGAIGLIIQILFWIAVSGSALYYLIKNRKALWQALKEMIKGFLSWLARVFAGTEQEEIDREEPTQQAQRMHPPFASFRNPFAAKTQMSLQELVEYSFSALESLGCELGIERHEDQTPNEFSQAMAEHIIPLGQSTLRLGRLYSLAAYAPSLLNQNCVQDLQAFWNQLSTVQICDPVTINK
ncbi:MAG: hypothetical protein VX876_04035 [Planctomycetota bacterium]|nr:hypothetical protein [Planctomycetota bacterium]